MKHACEVVLRMLTFDEEYCVQGTAFPTPSLQLLPRPQPRPLSLALRVGPFTVLNEYFPELGPCSTNEMGRTQRYVRVTLTFVGHTA